MSLARIWKPVKRQELNWSMGGCQPPLDALTRPGWVINSTQPRGGRKSCLPVVGLEHLL